jgi:hypothetical protein
MGIEPWNDIDGIAEELGEIPTTTTDHAWTDLGMKLGLYSERLVTNCLNRGMAINVVCFCL